MVESLLVKMLELFNWPKSSLSSHWHCHVSSFVGCLFGQFCLERGFGVGCFCVSVFCTSQRSRGRDVSTEVRAGASYVPSVISHLVSRSFRIVSLVLYVKLSAPICDCDYSWRVVLVLTDILFLLFSSLCSLWFMFPELSASIVGKQNRLSTPVTP